MIETELRAVESSDRPIPSSGWGGDGSRDDDSGEHWGWSEEPIDDGPPYRRPRIIRAIALATVAAVIAGSVGTWVVFLAVGSPRASFTVSAIQASTSKAGAASEPTALVRFAVLNDSNDASPATCQATLATRSTTVGSTSLRIPTLRGGQSATVTIRVPLNGAALAGHGPAATRVDCRPAPRTAR